jgi:uncharacterized protein (TIGR02679 family)
VTDVPAWLRDPGLAPLWSAVADRLERNGVAAQGSVTVRGLDRPARHALSGLLGRAVVRDSARVDLAELDSLLLVRAELGLVAVVSAVRGGLTDRVGLRSARDAARLAPFAAVRAWLAGRSQAQPAWTEPWLEGVRSAGLLSRLDDGPAAAQVLLHAAEIATELAAAEPGAVVARNELAARRTGDAHALDDGALCGALVLRALAAAAGREAPRTPDERRELWEEGGVASDTVSSTVLTLGLRPLVHGPLGARLHAAADSGDPVHLTAWDLARGDVAVPPGTAVLVCENPRVLEAAAARYGGEHAVVCSSGMPATVVRRLLAELDGAVLRYHGDFDWPGIAIANRLQRLGCRPWRMTAVDYLAAVRRDGVPLAGPGVTPSWDVQLGTQMRRAGTAVHEEAVLAELLAGLPGLPGESG